MLEPVEYKLKPFKKTLAVADYETDPFKHGRVPRPFVIGFYDGHGHREFWGDDCTRQFFDFLREEREAGTDYCVYMHNGGRFDFLYMLAEMDCGQTLSVINGRIVKAVFGGHEFRDSWALFPQPLSAYAKDAISYDKFEAHCRDTHRAEIVEYLRGDCRYLYEIVQPFVEEFGDVLTVGSVALRQLNSLYGFARIDERDDAALRPFYFGGRVQPFELGDLRGEWKLFDVNSMYPAAMKNTKHPVGHFTNSRRLSSRTAFARIEATSKGCLPWRDSEGKLGIKGALCFPERRGEFFASIHEIRMGQELGLLKVHSVECSFDFSEWTDFSAFVDKFFALRLEAKKNGDKARDLIYKRVANSAYGKFALDPRRFSEYRVLADYESPGQTRDMANPEGWFPEAEGPGYRIWERPTFGRLGRFLNVATAASITGAARANLMHGLHHSTRPIYCDTDSIICEAFDGDVDKLRLGAWDLEAEADRAAIAAKKIYALFRDGQVIKQASKGARLSADEIVRVARGECVTWRSEAPAFSFTREPAFVIRDIKRRLVEREELEDLESAA